MSFDVAAVREQFPILRDPGLHYLDNAATSQMPEAVLDALRRFETEQRANVHGGVHRLAREALETYQSARVDLGRYIGVPADEVVFTYSTTSAINLVASTFGETLREGDEIVLSVLEHHSNLLPWQALRARRGVVLNFLPMTEDGRLDLDALGRVVGGRCRLIALTHCSNVTGAVTDVAPIVDAARAVGAKVLLDGAQRVPHGPVDVSALGIDFYALSGHKMYGPTGIGALWGRRELLEAMPPFMVGGQMIREVTLEGATFLGPPRRFEAGTPPIAGAIGLGAAARWAGALDWDAAHDHRARLIAHILGGLADIPAIRVIGPTDLDRRIGVISFVVDGADDEAVCRILDRHGVATRSGHHCAQPLLRLLGLTGTVRASLAPYSDDSDVDALLDAVDDAGRKLR